MQNMDLAKLNTPQREAVLHGSGPVLVLAGAGSGKTRVITYRIVRLLRSGIPPQAIAALTFTNRAAEEMRERVAALLGDRKTASMLTMGTFHSLGLRILRSEHEAMGYPRGFVIYDTSDQLGVVRELLRGIDAGRRFDVRAILTRISLAKNAFVFPEEYVPNGDDEYDEITAEVYPRYQEALRAYAAVDFDDLLTATVRMFDQRDDVRARWQEKFRFVMVDEYQDTNRAQLKFVKTLVAEHENLCVVGDDDQSIYSWRGADPTNILHFDRMFPGARVIKLEQNYRSTPTILRAANAVIANNVNRHGKNLWSDIADGAKIVHASATDTESEARFVAREIGDIVGTDNLRYRDVAVLYRSNIQSRLIEESLRSASIPYVMYGGQQFYERKEVKDLIAYLRLALNQRDEIALRRVINYPARGIGATTLKRVEDHARASRTSMWRILEGASQMAESDKMRPSTVQAIENFVAIIERTRASLDGGARIIDVTRRLIDEIQLYDDLRNASPSAAAAQRRIDNVESLLRSLERHQEKRPGLGALAEYLRRLSLAVESEAGEDPGNKVVLTTLHGAKGLEFPIVFMIGLEEEILPHARTLKPQATDVMDLDHVTDVSEERRLAYVGITRAQRKLYLTRTQVRVSRGKNLPRTPSRFLQEIPAELLEERDIQAEERAPVSMGEARSLFQDLSAMLDLD
ncbi:UvrD/REP helicase [Haliangium ochraceum DSM 14365]|uniref:DNA 3'-5' helicase n=2 Tax=Haliangium ochraceum TaxID=80816 RepID=D0LIZ3_HALO1|nr:UvrD/REP helicase [Haliangium ochraceum DSM 14365]